MKSYRLVFSSLSKVVCCIAVFVLFPAVALGEIKREVFSNGEIFLRVEGLDDDLIHFEYGTGSPPSTAAPIQTTDMICVQGDNVPDGTCDTYSGPEMFSPGPNGTVETAALRILVDPNDLQVTVIDKTKNNTVLTTVRPHGLGQQTKGLLFTRTEDHDFYGLGQQFSESDRDNADFGWNGRVRQGGEFGNEHIGFNGGVNGNTQIPILYAVKGATTENYAVFFDNTRRHRWDFTSASHWNVETSGGALRFYVMTGPDLLDLRKDYMGLVGRPQVPPKRMFGLWISEFGYDDWAELERKLATLRSNQFPLDGFVLDLQWFGGIPSVTGQCAIGSLNFDTSAFPDPAATIQGLASDQGVGIMLIEEAYVCTELPEHAAFRAENCLVTTGVGSTQPTVVDGFFGSASIIDYTNEACGAFVHDFRREALIDLGVIGHWTDLGEPEVRDPNGGYAVGSHREAHNIFNFRWLRGIHSGYRTDDSDQRLFMMSRSGAAGIQRFGTAMWSGDISSRLSSLATHAGNQMHMSFSGIDYYGADIGGFHRNLEGDLSEMYTNWFAYGMLFDVPGRPHVENLCNCKETAPDRIGELASNLANAQLRYELVPYLYSLAHYAARTGEPVMPSPVVYYQTDSNVRTMGREKMIGRDLLAAILVRRGQNNVSVYLPQGTWVDWHTNRRIESIGQDIPNVPIRRNGLVRLPLYARAGAIIPMAPIDASTLNTLGERSDGAADTTLRIRAVAFDSPGAPGVVHENQFTLYEDDGRSDAYQQGGVRTTQIEHQRTSDDQIIVTVRPGEGTYAGAPTTRGVQIELVVDRSIKRVALNGTDLSMRTSADEFAANPEGWIAASRGLVLVKTGDRPVSTSREVVFTLGEVAPCASEFAVIAVPGEGNGWDPADPDRALTLECGDHPVWRGRLNLQAEEYKFAADGSWTTNWGQGGQQNGPNFPALAQPGVFDVTFDERNPAAATVTLVNPLPTSGARFVCENGDTTFGTSVYVVGSVAELGEWNPLQARLLKPDGPYPTWTGVISSLPTSGQIEWKCIKRVEDGDRRVIQWEPDPNNVLDRNVFEQVGRF